MTQHVNIPNLDDALPVQIWIAYDDSWKGHFRFIFDIDVDGDRSFHIADKFLLHLITERECGCCS